MDKIKVAVIGCGTIANAAHIPSYMNNPTAEIKYFCDIIPERAEAAVKQYGCGIAITDYHVALNDPEVEAVSVCTPNKAHTTIAIDAGGSARDGEDSEHRCGQPLQHRREQDPRADPSRRAG